MKIVVAGQGAFGVRHLEAIQKIEDVEVVSLAGGSPESTRQVAERFGIGHWTLDLGEALAQPGVDLFQYQTGEEASLARAIQGPLNAQLGIAMDMSVQMKVPYGAICTLSLSFNNEGPLGTFFRYICDNGTYIARYDDLVDGKDQPIDVSKVDVSMNGIELQDRELFAAIHEGRAPHASVAQVLPADRALDRLEKILGSA